MKPVPRIRIPGSGEDVPPWRARGAAVLQAGELVAFPTETFYGLGADPRSDAAVARLRAAKGTRPDGAILLLAASRRQVASICDLDGTDGAARLAGAFWPGALTLILPLRRGSRLPACPGGTAAVRVPGLGAARALAAAAGHPVTGTSANRSGAPAARTADEVQEVFGREVRLILDGGAAPGGRPSTLLDLTDAAGPRLLRPGVVAAGAIEAVLGCGPLGAGP